MVHSLLCFFPPFYFDIVEVLSSCAQRLTELLKRKIKRSRRGVAGLSTPPTLLTRDSQQAHGYNDAKSYAREQHSTVNYTPDKSGTSFQLEQVLSVQSARVGTNPLPKVTSGPCQ